MPDLNIASFEDFLRAARQQPEPQRLLFVFTGAELPKAARPRSVRVLPQAKAAHWCL